MMQHFDAVIEVIHSAEIMPEAQRNFWKKNAAFSTSPEFHGTIISQWIR
jgi:hypothetical protein